MIQYNLIFFSVTVAVIFLTLGFLLLLFLLHYIYLKKGQHSRKGLHWWAVGFMLVFLCCYVATILFLHILDLV